MSAPHAPRTSDSPRWTPEERYAAQEIGYTLLSEGKAEMARAIFQGLVRLDRGDVYSRVCLGVALTRLGRLAEAERHFEEAARVDGRRPEPAVHLAEARLAQGKRAEAAEALAMAEARSTPGRIHQRLAGRIALLRAALPGR